jgi:hypothetical protein
VNEAWEALSLYESRDIAARLFKQRHALELNADAAYGIVSHVAQAREYFSSAERAAPLVRPLLVYYGVLALSRGVILFLNPSAKEGTLKQAHGVTANTTLSAGIAKIGELGIELARGTFAELSAVTHNRERASVFKAPYPERAVLSRRALRRFQRLP